MPVTDGTLTERLVQAIGDIGGFFTTLGVKIDAIDTSLTEIKSMLGQQDNGYANSYMRAIAQTTGYNPGLDPLQVTSNYLVQSGDGTPLNRNLQSVVDQIFDLGGPLPDHANLFDIYDALGRDSATESLRQSFFNLNSNTLTTGETNLRRIAIILEQLRDGINVAGEPVTNLSQQQMITLLTQIKDRTGTAQNGLSMSELLQVISECICSMIPVDPPPGGELIPSTHLCAASKTILWKIEPGDWVQRVLGDGRWMAVPSSVNTAAIGWGLTTKNIGFDEVRIIKADLGVTELITNCSVTTDSTTLVIEEFSWETWAEFGMDATKLLDTGLSATALNVWDNSIGCKGLQIQGVGGDPDYVYHLLTCNVVGDNNAHPAITIYFYLSEPQ